MPFQVLFAHPSGTLCRVIVQAPNPTLAMDAAFAELVVAQCRSEDATRNAMLCLAILGDGPHHPAWLNPDGCR